MPIWFQAISLNNDYKNLCCKQMFCFFFQRGRGAGGGGGGRGGGMGGMFSFGQSTAKILKDDVGVRFR